MKVTKWVCIISFWIMFLCFVSAILIKIWTADKDFLVVAGKLAATGFVSLVITFFTFVIGMSLTEGELFED